MNFALFLLLNAILFIRPEELFPGIAGLRLYMLTIVSCTLLSLSRIAELLTLDALRQRPVAVCVLLFFASTILALLVRGRIDELLFSSGPAFAKVILYYFLLLAVVDTPERFRVFVGTLAVLIAAVTAIAFANHYDVINFPSIVPCRQVGIVPETGARTTFPRLVSSGIFNDPNDLCLVLGLGIWSCIYLATTTPSGAVERLVWLAPIPVFIHALFETHSRGGLLGVMAGGAGYLYSRFGGPKALPLAVAGGAVVMALVGGRQGSTDGGDTSHQRVMMWADGVFTLVHQPFWVPIGLGGNWFTGETGLLAHNSFVEAYVCYGLFGGGAFLGAFYLGARLLDRLGRSIDAPPWAVAARPFGFAVLVGYGVGCYSITRNYVVPTYLTLGLISFLLDQAGPPFPERHRVNRRWFLWLVGFSFIGLVLMVVATQLLGRAGF